MTARDSAGQIAVGPFCLNMADHRVMRDGVDVKLRPQAFSALKTLVQNSGHDVSYDQLIRDAWGAVSVSKHTVEVTVGEVKKALGEYSFWISRRPKLGYRFDIPESGELVRSGWHFCSQRTREGLERAVECFQKAALENGSDFRAFEGLSQCFLMLGVYGMRPPQQAYHCFLDAHRRAVALIGWTPELRCARAHGLHMFERKLGEAEREFLQAMREKPSLVPVYARLAMLYATTGRLDDALDVLLRGHKIDALFPALPATEAFVRFCRREFEAAAACGRRAVELYPYMELSRTFYALALEFAGRVDEALAQYQAARVICPGSLRLRTLEGVCLARNGCRRKASVVFEEIEQLRASDYVDAYFMAVLFDALGKRDDAYRELGRAIEENSAALYMLDVDPNMDPLRQGPRFAHLRCKWLDGNEARNPQPEAPAPLPALPGEFPHLRKI
jgi:DNA-binding winged helix-turn-helix (wHTH) protein